MLSQRLAVHDPLIASRRIAPRHIHKITMEQTFNTPAELYLGRDFTTAEAQGPRTFSSAAKAIRFAIEEAAPVALHGAMLKTAGKTYRGQELRQLYRSHSYPLARKAKTPNKTANKTANRRAA